MCSSAYLINFHGSKCIIVHTSSQKTVAQAQMVDHLYRLEITSSPSALVTSRSSVGLHPPSLVWHARLGHVGEAKLLSISKTQAYRHQLPLLEHLPFCEPCALGKLKKQPYAKKSVFCASRLIELVHTDLCGPISKPLFGGSNFFMPFIDDLSRMTFTYYLKHKIQALEVFQ